MDTEFLKYRFSDSYNGVIIKSKFTIGVRHLQIAYMLVCGMVMGAMRGSSVVAVFAMTDHTRINDTYIKIHDWDRRVQGQILSSFFFGYALMLVPAELYLKRVSGKLVMTVVLAANGALAVALPTITNRGGWLAVYNSYLCLGITQACLSPVLQSLLNQWLPPLERKSFSPIVHAGGLLGTVISLPVSGILSETHLGWELVFYSQAMMTLSMAIIWALLTSNQPDDHPLAGDTEKEFIKETLSYFKMKSMQVPWRKILSCKRFWAVTSAHAGSNAVFIFFITEVPVFLQLFGDNIRSSCLKAMYPFISMWLTHMVTSLLLDWTCRLLYHMFHLDVAYVRKSVNALSALGIVTGLTILPNLVPSWSRVTFAILIIVSQLHGLQFSGFLETHRDMSQNYSGSLLMLSGGIASWAGALVPALSGLVLADDAMDPKRWHLIMLSLGSFLVVCNVVYTMFGSSDIQDWDGKITLKSRDRIYHNRGMDANQVELEELNASEKKQKLETTLEI